MRETVHVSQDQDGAVIVTWPNEHNEREAAIIPEHSSTGKYLIALLDDIKGGRR